MQYSKPDPSSPQPNLSVYEKGAKTTAAQMLTGEQVCQGHGFDETECLSIGCCQWDPSTPEGCWSAVQNGVCYPSKSCPDIAGTCVIVEHFDPSWKGSLTTVDQTGCKGVVLASNMHTNQTLSSSFTAQFRTTNPGDGADVNGCFDDPEVGCWYGEWRQSYLQIEFGREGLSRSAKLDCNRIGGWWQSHSDKCKANFNKQLQRDPHRLPAQKKDTVTDSWVFEKTLPVSRSDVYDFSARCSDPYFGGLAGCCYNGRTNECDVCYVEDQVDCSSADLKCAGYCSSVFPVSHVPHRAHGKTIHIRT